LNRSLQRFDGVLGSQPALLARFSAGGVRAKGAGANPGTGLDAMKMR
jgi:hypothetical protein